MEQQFQNWEYTVLTKSKTKQTGEKACNKAGQQGQAVDTVNKSATNKKGQMTGQAMYKAVEEENFQTATISHSFKIALQQARVAKKIDQKTLASKINEKQSIISDYENGRAIPNGQVINKLERALGCKLPRDQKPKTVKEE